jgi:histidinol-phosphatase (PHP family)
MKNFHTHTSRCHHAVGDVSDYIKSALDKKMTHLGFSDHTPLPDNRWPDVRMHMGELEDYVYDIESAKKNFPDIQIYLGAECEYAPEYVNYYKEELIDRYRFQYLVGGAHYFPCNGEWVNCYGAENSRRNLAAYTDYLIRSIDSGLFSFIAHPDLFARFYLQWDSEAESCSKAILEAASDKNALLEINGYGYRKTEIDTIEGKRRPYPIEPFWDMAAEYKIPVIINSDAHKPEDVDHFGDSIRLAERLNLEIKDLQLI